MEEQRQKKKKIAQQVLYHLVFSSFSVCGFFYIFIFSAAARTEYVYVYILYIYLMCVPRMGRVGQREKKVKQQKSMAQK